MKKTIYSRRQVLGFISASLLTANVPLFAQAENIPVIREHDMVVAMVEKASSAIAKYGFPNALSRTKRELWSRPSFGLYVFVLDTEGTLLLHPDKRGGHQNVIASHDIQGTPFIRNMIHAATDAHGVGVWTRYLWTDANSGELGTKHTYSKAINGMIISSGYLATKGLGS